MDLPGGDGHFRLAFRHRQPAAVHGGTHGGADFRRVDRAALIGKAHRDIERRRIDAAELRPAERDRAAAVEAPDDGLRTQSLALALQLRCQLRRQ